MGGKRPDQYGIDPSEAGATDYKNLPQTGRGESSDLDDPKLDKQKLAQSERDAEGQPFPPDVPAPSEDVKRGEKIPREPGAADTEPGKENPLV